uniref:Uncharacterized protein n=1 Tax=Mus musculus TaxID=10090 RepID=Q9D1S6_MOUSE|nr:unnamed protein product [Mus musculus]
MLSLQASRCILVRSDKLLRSHGAFPQENSSLCRVGTSWRRSFLFTKETGYADLFISLPVGSCSIAIVPVPFPPRSMPFTPSQEDMYRSYFRLWLFASNSDIQMTTDVALALKKLLTVLSHLTPHTEDLI